MSYVLTLRYLPSNDTLCVTQSSIIEDEWKLKEKLLTTGNRHLPNKQDLKPWTPHFKRPRDDVKLIKPVTAQIVFT